MQLPPWLEIYHAAEAPPAKEVSNFLPSILKATAVSYKSEIFLANT